MASNQELSNIQDLLDNKITLAEQVRFLLTSRSKELSAAGKVEASYRMAMTLTLARLQVAYLPVPVDKRRWKMEKSVESCKGEQDIIPFLAKNLMTVFTGWSTASIREWTVAHYRLTSPEYVALEEQKKSRTKATKEATKEAKEQQAASGHDVAETEEVVTDFFRQVPDNIPAKDVLVQVLQLVPGEQGIKAREAFNQMLDDRISLLTTAVKQKDQIEKLQYELDSLRPVAVNQ